MKMSRTWFAGKRLEDFRPKPPEPQPPCAKDDIVLEDYDHVLYKTKDGKIERWDRWQ